MSPFSMIKSLVSIIVLMVSVGLTANVYGQIDMKIEVSDWKLIKALDGSASVYAPRQMEIRIDTIATDVGDVVTVHHVLKQSTEYSPNFVFHFSYTLYPEGMIDRDSIAVVDDILKTTVDNSVLMQNATLIYSADKAYKDHKGMIWKTRYAEDAYVMKSEIYYVNDHLYMLQVGSLADTPTGEAVDHFFTSLKIQDPTKLAK